MTTPFPSHFNNQVAEKSILDAFNKQVYLGNTFSLITSLSLGDTSEHLEFLLTNPATSQKALFLLRRKISSSAGVYVKMYLNPTISGNGTPVTPINLRPAYTATSAASCYIAPSASANGTLITADGTLNFTQVIDNLIVIDPGSSVLISAQSLTGSGGTPTTAIIENIWYEL